MAQKYQIGKEVEESLREISQRLPVPEMKGRTPQTGAQLQAETPGIRDKHGKELDPAKLYYVGSGVESVNHLRRMRKAYEQGGDAALVAYLLPYESFLIGPEQVAEALQGAQGAE